MWSLSFTDVPSATREQSGSCGSCIHCVSCRRKTRGPFYLAQSRDHHQGSDVASTFHAGGPSRLTVCVVTFFVRRAVCGLAVRESVHT